MSIEDTSIAVAQVLATLARSFIDTGGSRISGQHDVGGTKFGLVALPGIPSQTKSSLEQELNALITRIHVLETKAGLASSITLPTTPNEPALAQTVSLDTDASVSGEAEYRYTIHNQQPDAIVDVGDVLDSPRSDSAGRAGLISLTAEQMAAVEDRTRRQAEQIQHQQQTIRSIHEDLEGYRLRANRCLEDNSHSVEDIGALKHELKRNQQANLAFQKSLREIGNIVTAVANGDLSMKVLIHAKELDPEITTFKRTINKMIDQLQEFASQVTVLAKETGTEGRLGGQAVVPGVSGIWAELTENVNVMSAQLTEQVRDIAKVTTAVAKGDLTQKVSATCKGEILQLKITINAMVDQLRQFANEVTALALEVGTEGRLGGQATVHGVEGTWKTLTLTVNTLAKRLTEQVREIAEVTTAVAKGDLSKKVEADVKGEILELKVTINSMVDRLRTFGTEVSKVAREVGTEGILGGQAKVENAEGRWKDLTDNVNTMANSLTAQVRAFASFATAAIDGDFTKEITVEASGEMGLLKKKINTMVSGLRESFEKINKARDTAELANKTKSEFLANMSHEIRTPMNGIIGMTQLTLDSDLQGGQREMLNTVHSLANSLLTIIDDILDISKIEANRMDLEQIPFSLRGTIYNALKSLAVKANERFLNLAYQVDSSIPDWVVGDPFRLRQIIINLAGNSLKFTERGEVKVKICECYEVKGADAYMIKFAVSDTGIGIHEDKVDLIFETFQQADGSTTRRFGGTGLGLSISKRLVNLMGGKMRVESIYGRGSTFFFTCQFAKADTNVSVIRPALRPYKRHTVLFVDRGHTGCPDAIVEAILQLGLVPLLVRQGDNRPLPELPSVNGQAYDCVIVDCNATARTLRKVDKFKYIPFVMLAPAITVSFKSALEDGISSYMTTPCLPIDLGNALIPALEGRATPSVSDQSRSFDILLAEDNLVNQKLAVRILEKYHHKVTVANNGLEAFEKVKEKRFDVLLMDLQMPIMGGFEATDTIRKFEAHHNLPRTPIIALTAHAMVGDREMCLKNQMDEYLSKPLKPNQLLQTILKCATMGGAMLDIKNKNRRSLLLENEPIVPPASPTPSSPALSQRPRLENRGFTEAPFGLESPPIVTAYQMDPLETLIRSHSN